MEYLALLPFLLIGGAIFWVRSSQIGEWNKLKTLADYMTLYPGTKTTRGLRCCNCGSSQLRNVGLFQANDNRRIIRCVHCDAPLYRAERT